MHYPGLYTKTPSVILVSHSDHNRTTDSCFAEISGEDRTVELMLTAAHAVFPPPTECRIIGIHARLVTEPGFARGPACREKFIYGANELYYWSK
jgi:hypothetical protein